MIATRPAVMGFFNRMIINMEQHDQRLAEFDKWLAEIYETNQEINNMEQPTITEQQAEALHGLDDVEKYIDRLSTLAEEDLALAISIYYPVYVRLSQICNRAIQENSYYERLARDRKQKMFEWFSNIK